MLMPNTSTVQHRSFVYVLIFVVLVTLTTFAWFNWNVWQQVTGSQKRYTQLLEIDRLQHQITYLNEALTMSARLAATTGDMRWEERYRQFEPQLDTAIQSVLSLPENII